MPTSSSVNVEFDVAIAGAGMAGSMLAWALLQQQPGLNIAIIEQQAEQISPISFDSRSIALAAASCQLLQQWQLWSSLQTKACAIQQIKVSDRGHFGKTTMHAADYHQPALGYVIEVEHLGNLLADKLAKCAQLQRFQPNRISAITPQPDYQQLQLADGHELRCRLLVIAEGGSSPSRTLAGIQLSEQHYQQCAVIANVALASSHQHIAHERFTEHGPVALLPLSGQRYSLVYTTTPDEAARLMQLTDAAFIDQLQQAFGYRAGVFTSAGQRAMYPLALRTADDIVRHRLALLGNSLHNLHPIAGQGFNLAMRDIQELVKQLAQHADIGGYAMLRGYQQARQQDIQQVSLATDALVRLFSNRSRLVALARNSGLLALQLCDGLKASLARQAMGFRSEHAKR